MFIYVLFLSVLHFYNKNVTHTFDNIVLSFGMGSLSFQNKATNNSILEFYKPI